MPTKFRVEITGSAENDIEEIWTFLTEDNPEAATRFVLQIENKIDTLEHFPERCPIASASGLLGTRYRQLLVGNYRVIFRVSVKTVIVLRVIHAARLLELRTKGATVRASRTLLRDGGRLGQPSVS